MDDPRSLSRVKLPKFRERLERLVDRVDRPVMSGEIALEIGVSLAQVEREMEALCEAGAYRVAEVSELRSRGWDPRVLAYVRSGTKT